MARSTDPADYQDVARPVAAMPKEFADGHHIPPHSHRRAQFVHAISGTMRVTTPGGAWVVPPKRAVWIPPETVHEIRMVGDVAMRTLYIEPGAAAGMPDDRCIVVEVSVLLRELILAMIDEPVEYPERGRAGALVALILDELRRAATVPVRVPLPADPRLLSLCRTMLDDLAADRTLEGWAERIGASGRTLARLFRRETGLSFGAWRQQARLAEALSRLSEGQGVATVADALGYDSASAFAAMFRRALGNAPSRYVGARGASLLGAPLLHAARGKVGARAGRGS